MLTRFRRDDILLGAAVILLAVAIPLGVVSCDKVPLLAPTGTVITLIPTSNSLSLNSEITIVATVIENGAVAGTGTGTTTRSGAGTPVQNGTVITFTTTIGRIEPAEARTHNGQATVRLISGGQSGTARITAFSGGASTAIDVKVGATAAEKVVMSAAPSTLPPGGGESTITAIVSDAGGSGVANVPVTFVTSAGRVSPTSVSTDPNGIAQTTLTTSITATVTARIAGAPNDTGGGSGATGSNSTTVTVGARGLTAFSASPNPATVGQVVTFTVTPNTNANITGGTLSFGDGQSTPISPIGGTITHTYSAPGNYTATATINNGSGGTETFTTNVTVTSLALTLAADPASPAVNAPVTFTVGGLGTAAVSEFRWSASSGETAITTGPSWSTSFSSPGVRTITVNVIGVDGRSLGTTQRNVNVQ
jgi:plastocyanin